MMFRLTSPHLISGNKGLAFRWLQPEIFCKRLVNGDENNPSNPQNIDLNQEGKSMVKQLFG